MICPVLSSWSKLLKRGGGGRVFSWVGPFERVIDSNNLCVALCEVMVE